MHPYILSFLQLCLATLAFAAPIAEETFATTSNSLGYGTGGGIVGLIILVLDILVFGTSNYPGARTFICLGHTKKYTIGVWILLTIRKKYS